MLCEGFHSILKVHRKLVTRLKEWEKNNGELRLARCQGTKDRGFQNTISFPQPQDSTYLGASWKELRGFQVVGVCLTGFYDVICPRPCQLPVPKEEAWSVAS